MDNAILAFCSTRRIVVPASWRLWMISKISSTSTGASPIEGSSSIISLGSLIRALPIASIWSSPPESVPATCLYLSFRRGKWAYTFSRLPSIVLAGAVNAPISRFSLTVICMNMRRPSGTCESPIFTILCAGTLVISWPWNSIPPVFGLMIPDIVLRVVDFPAPFAPIRVTISPSSTSREIPLSAWIAP